MSDKRKRVDSEGSLGDKGTKDPKLECPNCGEIFRQSQGRPCENCGEFFWCSQCGEKGSWCPECPNESDIIDATEQQQSDCEDQTEEDALSEAKEDGDDEKYEDDEDEDEEDEDEEWF